VGEIRKALDEYPHARYVHISQNDGGGLFCTCDQCSALTEKEGSLAGTQLHFVNTLAKEIEKSHPGVNLVTFAYKETVQPPRHVRPRKNVIIEMCTDVHWPKANIPLREDPAFTQPFQGWKNLGARLLIWDYVVPLNNLLLPSPTLKLSAENIRYLQRNGVEGIFLQGAYQPNSTGTERQYMRSWVYSKLLWNPDRDVMTLMRDFTYHYYEEAAEPMHEYYVWLESQWDRFRAGEVLSEQLPWLPADLYDQAMPYFARAEKLARQDKIKERIRVAKLSVSYHRLLVGPNNQADVESYKTEMENFRQETRALKVTRAGERKEMDSFHRNNRQRWADGHATVTQGAHRFEENDFVIRDNWPEREKPRVVSDRSASNLFALRHNAQVSERRVWLHMTSHRRKIDPNKSYCVKVGIKTIHKRGANPRSKALELYVLTTPPREFLVTKDVSLRELKNGQYQEFELCEFDFRKSLQFGLRTPEGNGLEEVYVDYVELIPKD
jgi:hypothetical protein